MDKRVSNISDYSLTRKNRRIPQSKSQSSRNNNTRPQKYDARRQSAVAEYRNKQAKLRSDRIFSARWRNIKLCIIAFFFVCALGFLLAEILRLQSFAGDTYAMRTLAQIIDFHSSGDRIVEPTRGSITDRNMQALAVSSVVYNMFVDVRKLAGRDADDFAATKRALTEFFSMTEVDFAGMMAVNSDGVLINNTMHYIVERGIHHSRVAEFEHWKETLEISARDVYFEETTHRNYLHNNLAAPIIGFERGYWWGLEQQYDEFLRGLPGRTMTTFDNEGSIFTDRIAPIHGANVIVTLDMNIQRLSEDVVAHYALDFEAGNASVIVMQPFTGEILAMSQYPGFDANDPSNIERFTSPAIAQRMSEMEPYSPEYMENLFAVWRNFNVSTPFEPGSIYKPFTFAKALEEGAISLNQSFYCPGYKEVAGIRINCASRWGHGWQTLTEALANSCNPATMDIAEALGRNLFSKYQRDFGYGLTTGIDLPGEASGIIFSASELNATELATSSFGQRFTATSIQSIASFAALINGGNVVRPHLVSQIVDTDGSIVYTAPSSPQRRVISQSTSDWMRRAMEYVVTDGTGRTAAIEGYAQGGKTGTAEQGLQDDDDFTWSLTYIGYFPIENPQYLIFVALHDVPSEIFEARAGNRSIIPMYREIAQGIIALHNIPPTNIVETPGIIHEAEFIEDYVGLSVRDALAKLNSMGISYEFFGTGGNTIASQFPVAGARSTGNTMIVLSLSDDGSEALLSVPNVTNLPVDFAREILTGAGFLPRVSFESYLDYNEAHENFEAIVYEQPSMGLSLPYGTEVLLKVRLEE